MERIGTYLGKAPPLPSIEAAEQLIRMVSAPFGPHSDEQWRTLRDGLRHEADQWRKVVTGRTNWDDLGAAAALSTAAHTAYHLGAIRQILAALGAG